MASTNLVFGNAKFTSTAEQLFILYEIGDESGSRAFFLSLSSEYSCKICSCTETHTHATHAHHTHHLCTTTYNYTQIATASFVRSPRPSIAS
jgi:hypothetical protein